ncbi:heterokaryon incompatibility protein-domain-containing protein [Fusarium tricinctum]|uniref:Heterokaryon incompatibility protein-domain-containing protein n=1 Tax=Fusarium tricinctum TaxID=61284 RepID=A0A8K0RTK6_9HYPO|nr:heterokaryon incompatibility protein-domain-containing protein [Fusarium tricinctum]
MELPWEARIARDPKFKSQSSTQGLLPLARFLWDYSTAEGVKAGHKAAFQSGKQKLGGLLSTLQGSSSANTDLPSDEFVHSPLGDTRDLRLVHVTTQDSTLRCSVKTYPASEIPPYVCLSYVWADFGPMLNRGRDFRETELEVPHFSHADTTEIVLNDRRFSIGANLRAALLGLEKRLNGRPIWIDAVCINQTDSTEKATQVAHMGEIYSAAEKVFVWLGRKHTERTASMSILREWPAFPDDPNNANIQFHGKKYNTAKAFFDATSTGSELLSWISLLRTVTESWWSRVWTVQEFILARGYAFFYDGEEIPTAELKKAMDWTYFMAGHLSPKMIPHWVTFQPSIFDLKKSEAKLSLLAVALLGATRMAGDPRDKVWAFLGITDPASIGQTPVKPNYDNRNMGDFYLDIAQRLIRGDAGLLVLSLVNHPLPKESYTFKSTKPIGNQWLDQYKAKKRLPSQDPAWAPPKEDVFDQTLQPDWSGKKVGYPSWVFKMASAVAIEPLFLREMKVQKARGRPLHDASWRIFHAASKIGSEVSLSADGRALPLNAGILDTISKVAALPKKPEDEKTFHKFIRSWYPGRTRLIGIPYPPQPSTTVPDALWRTLLMNIWLTTHPAPDACGEHFSSYLARISDSASGAKHDLRSKHKPDPEDGDIFSTAMDESGTDRVLFVTEKGYLGLGPARTQVGDSVSLIVGAHVPFVLRKGTQGWILIGESYVHGVMYGEATRGANFQKIVII